MEACELICGWDVSTVAAPLLYAGLLQRCSVQVRRMMREGKVNHWKFSRLSSWKTGGQIFAHVRAAIPGFVDDSQATIKTFQKR